ncbi:hypothetical protein ILYODFUR_027849 [Ilyodon furcidens]|uniref:Uncharacterized protein n=1 Tax=Ilyodon furcidens TaxID=33524 RepID=A0ABV0U917_9TELE
MITKVLLPSFTCCNVSIISKQRTKALTEQSLLKHYKPCQDVPTLIPTEHEALDAGGTWLGFLQCAVHLLVNSCELYEGFGASSNKTQWSLEQLMLLEGPTAENQQPQRGATGGRNACS